MALMKIIMCWGLLWQIDYSHIPTPGEGNGLVSNGVFFIWSCLTKMLSMSLWLFSYSVVSSSLRPHGLQHARLPCPSPTPRACSNSCPLSWWCHHNGNIFLGSGTSLITADFLTFLNLYKTYNFPAVVKLVRRVCPTLCFPKLTAMGDLTWQIQNM